MYKNKIKIVVYGLKNYIETLINKNQIITEDKNNFMYLK